MALITTYVDALDTLTGEDILFWDKISEKPFDGQDSIYTMDNDGAFKEWTSVADAITYVRENGGVAFFADGHIGFYRVHCEDDFDELGETQMTDEEIALLEDDGRGY